MRQMVVLSGAFLFLMRRILRLINPSWLALAALLLIAAWLRFTHLDWDGGNQLHPDERAILFVASEIHLPESLPQALDVSHSPLNPFYSPDGQSRSYPYGHVPLYLTVALSHLFKAVCEASRNCIFIASDTLLGRLLNVAGDPAYVHYTYVGRALSAVFDWIAIVITFLIARRLFNAFAAFSAASLHTFAFIHVQNAHFGTVDIALTLFSSLTILFLILFLQEEQSRYSILAGACAGLALGSKATAIYLVAPFLFAHLQFRPALKLIRIETFWFTALAALLVFALTNPYALLDFVPFITSVVTQAQVTSGSVDYPFTRQYSNTLPLIYAIDQQARAFLGLPSAIAVGFGVVIAFTTQFRQRSRAHMMVLVWIIVIFMTAGVQFVKFPRYMLPALPIMFVLTGGVMSSAALRYWQRYALILLIVIPSAFYTVALVKMYEEPHPWVAASQWIYTEVPPKMRIISELWDDPLPLDLVIDKTGYLREAHVESVLIHPFDEPDDLEKLQTISQEIAAADYIILSSNRLYGVIPRLAERYPISSAYYQALFDEDLGYVLDRTFARYPKLFGISLVDDPLVWPALTDPGIDWPDSSIRIGYIDESFAIYDHPLVLVFHNIYRLSQHEIEDRILAYAVGEEQ